MKYLFIITILILSISCKKYDKKPINQEELITTIKLILTDSNNINYTYIFNDIDGDGGEIPTIDTIYLLTNMSYTASLQLLNESIYPPDNITEEIVAEAEAHQFFYSSTPNIAFTYDDADADGNPIGLSFSFNSGSVTNNNGNFTITLRHQPDKFATNVSNGDITNANGETDIAISFPLVIE